MKQFFKKTKYAKMVFPIINFLVLSPLVYVSLGSGIAYSRLLTRAYSPSEFEVVSWVIKNKYPTDAQHLFFLSTPDWVVWDNWFLKVLLNSSYLPHTNNVFLPSKEEIDKWCMSAHDNKYLLVFEKFSNDIKPYLDKFSIVYQKGNVYFLTPK